ncbi:hypothetical protein GCM10022232_27270 [Streptomyces plumbiresistens]|uniref:Uncharacterized protein n=1 Tax=Streptomyces plumbiresistens TaxID=511811 RepID=A0ABP7R2P6_9ACTN
MLGEYAKVSRTSADYVKPMPASIGALAVGRHVFDITNGWEDKPPAGEHIVVVSHRPRPEGWHPEAPFHSVGDVTRAIAKAKELAGDRTVGVAAGGPAHGDPGRRRTAPALPGPPPTPTTERQPHSSTPVRMNHAKELATQIRTGVALCRGNDL